MNDETVILSKVNGYEIVTFNCRLDEMENGQDFKPRAFMALHTMGYKGLVFNVANNPPSNPILVTRRGAIGYLNLDAVILNEALQVVEGNRVRVMYFNERDPEEFVRAKPYFLERLTKFGIREDVTKEEYNSFTVLWNKLNPQNLIYVDPSPGMPVNEENKIPKQTKEDDVLSVTIATP